MTCRSAAARGMVLRVDVVEAALRAPLPSSILWSSPAGGA